MARKTFLAGTIAAVVLLICVGCAHTSTLSSQPPATNPRQAEIDAAVERGLDWLVKTQGEDGLWYNTGDNTLMVSSIAGLALLHRAAYADNPEKYMKAAQKTATSVMMRLDSRTGQIQLPSAVGRSSFGRCAYDQAVGLLFLLQAWQTGITFNEEKWRTENRFSKAIEFIQRKQDPTGCWYQDYRSGHKDFPTTLHLYALIAAQDAGLEIDRKVLEEGMKFVETYLQYAQLPEWKATVIAAILICDMCDNPVRQEAVKNFAATCEANQNIDSTTLKYPIAYELFASMACFHLGGKYWDAYYEGAVERYLAKQNASGSWPGVQDIRSIPPNEVYTTAVACLILQMPRRALPMYKNIDSDAARSKLQLEN